MLQSEGWGGSILSRTGAVLEKKVSSLIRVFKQQGFLYKIQVWTFPALIVLDKNDT